MHPNVPHLAVAPQLCMQPAGTPRISVPEWLTQPCPLRGQLYAYSAKAQPAKTKPYLSVSQSRTRDAKCLPGHGKRGRHEAGTYMADVLKALRDLDVTNCFCCLLPECSHGARRSSKQNQHRAGKACSQLKGMGAGQLTHGMKYAECTTGG